jgi:nucleoid-associated protein YgaU
MHFARSLGTSFGHQLPVAGAVLALSLGVACGGGAPPQATATAGAAQPSPTQPARPTFTAPAPSPSPLASPSPDVGAQTYTVEPGDTLQTIAEQFYGDATQWQRIYNANRDAIGDTPDALKVGTQLRIPPKE